MLPASCCVLRAACFVLRAACGVLRAAFRTMSDDGGGGGGLEALAKAAQRPKPNPIDTGAEAKTAGSKGSSRVPVLKTPKTGSKEKSARLKRLQEQRARRRAEATPGGPRASKDEMKRTVAAREAARVAAIKAAEVHFIGELSACSGFDGGVSCRYTLDYGTNWCMASGDYETKEGGSAVVSGSTLDSDAGGADAASNEGAAGTDDPASASGLARKPIGQTQYAYRSAFGEPVWSHPLEFHCKSKLLSGWPRLLLEVFQLDRHGRNDLVGYGIVDLPKVPGSHELECTTWRPRGSRKQEYSAYFLGGHPRLSSSGMQVLYKDAWDHRCQLTTVPSGTVYLQIDVLMKNFNDESMHWLV